MKAYETRALGLDSIVWTKNAARARYVTLQAARSAGYTIKFSDIKVKRVPQWDNPQKTRREDFCYDPRELKAQERV
jgi:hypothetical protein